MSGLSPDVGAGFPGEDLQSECRFSMFASLADARPKTVTLADLRMLISEGKCAELVNRIRAEPDKARRSEFKRGLPCVTVSGEFAGGHKAEHLVRHSGLLCVDFDGADNPCLAGHAEEWRDRLTKDESVMLAFVSASGNGVAAVCRIEPERHAESFDAARDHFKVVYGLEADRSCRDVSRLRFLSHDPGAAGNPSARVIKVCSVPPAPKPERPGLLCAAAPTLPKERREEILSALERVSPDDRQAWLDVGMAIHSEAPGLEGLNLWRVWSELNDTGAKFNEPDLERVWRSFGQRSGIGMGTLFKLAYNAGWTGAPAPKAVLPKEVAAKAKKGFTVKTWGEITRAILTVKRFILGVLFACGQLQTLFGQGGLGKSRVALNIARNQVLGLPFLGQPTGDAPLRHLFIGSENDIHRWQTDMRAMSRGLDDAALAKLEEYIRVTTLENAEDCYINIGDERNIEKWRETLRAWPPDVLYVDPWGDVLEGDGFDRDVRSTLSTLRKLAGEVNPECGIVILAHARTGATNIAQATGFDAANFGKDSKALFSCSRAVVNMAPYDASENPDLCWVPAKNNNGRRPEPLRIRLYPETMTYSVIEPLDVEAWQAEVKAAAKLTPKRASVKFDPDAALGLVSTTPLTKTELHAAVRGWKVTELDTRAGIKALIRTGKLVEQKAEKGNTWLIGTPESFKNMTSSTMPPSDSSNSSK